MNPTITNRAYVLKKLLDYSKGGKAQAETGHLPEGSPEDEKPGKSKQLLCQRKNSNDLQILFTKKEF